ncbi:DUF4142 domain-containing protein [Bradyrhizobium jicamae]|nr:DUF4142 domain-containing protein [Bradyrhizobium jicamae]
MFEIQSSKLAEERGNAAEKSLCKDHETTTNDLKSMVSDAELKVTLPTELDGSLQSKIDKLKSLKGADLARAMTAISSAGTRTQCRRPQLFCPTGWGRFTFGYSRAIFEEAPGERALLRNKRRQRSLFMASGFWSEAPGGRKIWGWQPQLSDLIAGAFSALLPYQLVVHHQLRPPSTRPLVGPACSAFSRSHSAHSPLDLR